MSGDLKYFSTPLRFVEPKDDSDPNGLCIFDTAGNLVAKLFWPGHPVAETEAAEQETYALGRAMAACALLPLHAFAERFAPQWPQSKGDPIRPVWSYAGKKGLSEAQALRMFAHELVERIKWLEAAPREVMKQAQDKDGVDGVALMNAYLKTMAGQRKHIATLEAKLKAAEQLLTAKDAEIAVSDKLIAERNRLLDAIPRCAEHGACVPHAIEWVEARRTEPPSEIDRLQRENLLLAEECDVGPMAHREFDRLRERDRIATAHIDRVTDHLKRLAGAIGKGPCDEGELVDAAIARLSEPPAVALAALEHVLKVFKSMADRGRYPIELLPELEGEPNPHYLGKQGWEFLTDAIASLRTAYECQHDLLKPGTTIEVIDAWKAKCKVCIEFFDLPGRPVDLHSWRCKHGSEHAGAIAVALCGCERPTEELRTELEEQDDRDLDAWHSDR